MICELDVATLFEKVIVPWFRVKNWPLLSSLTRQLTLMDKLMYLPNRILAVWVNTWPVSEMVASIALTVCVLIFPVSFSQRKALL
ncbi:hypothetical protein D9M69_554960 [compost metagenome]